MKRHVALPVDHGSWVLLLGPLLIGLFVGGEFRTTSLYLVVGALCAFLARQPATIAVKALSGRRSREDLPEALIWITVYAGVALVMLTGLVLRGLGYVLYLAIPGLPVFAWFLYLVSRRAERRQAFVEILAAGALALSAPAAYWVAVGRADGSGWILWPLTWAQGATSIVYAYFRLAGRGEAAGASVSVGLRDARASIALATGSLLVVLGLGLAGIVSRWLFLAYAVQWADVMHGRRRSTAGIRPAAIGMRLLAVSALFTAVFILTY